VLAQQRAGKAGERGGQDQAVVDPCVEDVVQPDPAQARPDMEHIEHERQRRKSRESLDREGWM
jgi:hypothetical protein